MEPAILQLGVAGVMVLMLLYGIGWFSKRDERNQDKLDEAAKDCAQREGKLVLRLQSLEDSRNHDLMNVVSGAVQALQEAGSALRTNADTFQRWTEESGQHRAQRRSPE